jgi:GT2 family glycosyltransferase
VAIIVPTLGTRQNLLRLTLESIRRAGDVHLAIVAPENFRNSPILEDFLVDQFILDPGIGLVPAVNRAIIELPPEIDYLNWLGDDDLLSEDSIRSCVEVLNQNPEVSFTYGQCEYINSEGNVIGVNKSGSWAKKLILFGPDLIPQPGALIRRSSLQSIGGLDEKFTHAFDMDMFTKLLQIGFGHYMNQICASFRWHPDSLSVKSRSKSAYEASQIRRSNLPRGIKPLSFFWEIPITAIVYLLGFFVSVKSKRI